MSKFAFSGPVNNLGRGKVHERWIQVNRRSFLFYSTFYGMCYRMCYNIYMPKQIVKLTRSSRYSYSIVVPKEFIEKYGWQAKQKLTVEDKGRGKLEIKDWRRR